MAGDRRRLLVRCIALITPALLACTQGSGVMPVTIRNDSNADVVLKQCDVRCDVTHEEDKLQSGQSLVVNTSYANVDNYWMVLDASGQRLGCLDLVFRQRQDNVLVLISSAGVCP
jgi:hypothetical protein